jgi:hypothetical protein
MCDGNGNGDGNNEMCGGDGKTCTGEGNPCAGNGKTFSDVDNVACDDASGGETCIGASELPGSGDSETSDGINEMGGDDGEVREASDTSGETNVSDVEDAREVETIFAIDILSAIGVRGDLIVCSEFWATQDRFSGSDCRPSERDDTVCDDECTRSKYTGAFRSS